MNDAPMHDEFLAGRTIDAMNAAHDLAARRAAIQRELHDLIPPSQRERILVGLLAVSHETNMRLVSAAAEGIVPPELAKVIRERMTVEAAEQLQAEVEAFTKELGGDE